MKTLNQIKNIIENNSSEFVKSKNRSARGRGVKNYALDLIDAAIDYKGGEYMPENNAELKKILLTGATDWNSYSWSGCALIYDGDICEALCTPSEIKKTRNGELRPNSREEWLDVQARALSQAASLINWIYR